MTQDKKRLVVILSIFVFGVLCALVVRRIMWEGITQPLLAGLGCFFIFFILVTRKAYRDFLTKMPLIYFLLSGIFLYFLVFAQYIDRNASMFPFITWNMYQFKIPSSEVMFFEYRGVTQDGKEIEINPIKIYPSLARFRLEVELERRLQRLALKKEGGDVSVEEAKGYKKVVRGVRSFFAEKPLPSLAEQNDQLLQIFIAIANQYNAKHPFARIHGVRIYLGTQNIREKPKPQTKYTLVWAAEFTRGDG